MMMMMMMMKLKNRALKPGHQKSEENLEIEVEPPCFYKCFLVHTEECCLRILVYLVIYDSG